MFKSWVRLLIFALLFMSMVVYPFETGVQASQSEGSPGLSPIRQTIDVSHSNLPPGFQIISIARDSLILDIQAPSYSFEPGKSEAESCKMLKADGYAQSAEPGEPALLSTGVMLGMPLDVDPSIRILSIETVELSEQVHLCPAATPMISRESNGSVKFLEDSLAENPQAYSQEAFVPAQPFEIVTSGMIRSQRVARLQFMPLQYNPSRDALRLVRHLRLEIQLGGDEVLRNPSNLVDEGPFEELLKKILINYDQARPWRAQPEPELAVFTTPSDPQDDPVYKIQVNQDGIYQVSYTALQSAGVPVSDLNALDPRTFRLLNQGAEVPIYVFGEGDGIFSPGDYILFYGQKVNTRYTATNIYWLSWGAGNGLRMAAQNGAVTGSAAAPDSYKTTQRVEENHLYRNADPSGPGNDHWYWSIITAYNAPASQNFPFQLQNRASGSLSARVRGLIKGTYGSPQHHTRVLLNGQVLDDAYWPSTGERNFAVDIPQSYLVEGTNTLTVECPRDGGITIDQVLVNWFEIDYYHTYTAENNLLVFGGDQPGSWEFRVGGFSSSIIDVFDITDPLAPARIVGGSVSLDGSLYRLSIEQQVSGARHYLALSPSRWLSPVAITQNVPSTLRSPANGADYIIISHQNFLDAIQPLATYRAAQGLRVKVVDVQDVYDEFNGGVFDAQAIQSFLSYAYSHWITPAPSYVLLVGDGHFDFLNFRGTSGPNRIPPFLGEFDPWIGETAADNRYVTVSGGDTLPDMYIGRLPVNSAAETTAMVTKIMAYEQNPLQGDWNTHVTFVADNADSGGNFPVLSNNVADHYLPPAYVIEKIYYGFAPYTTPAVAQAAVLNAINQGRLIVNYTGHASVQLWASEQLLNVNSIASLTNTTKYPFFAPMTCLEGYFIDPTTPSSNSPSVVESLVLASGKGAIASFSPTGFGLANGHDILAQGLYHAFFTDGTLQFGPATTFAKYYLDTNSSGYMDLLDTYALFGDPASRLRANPTAVLLASFTGSSLPGAVQLDWETANEVGLVGFNLYRSETIGGVKQQVNPSLIPANHRGQLQGDVYQYIDPVGPGIYYYWLELVQIGGSDLTEPIQVTSGYSVHLPMLTK